ncbi:hypothetical protein JFPO14_contig00003-0309 [Edwardsiella piscicida]|nr:hypothetical protein JFPO13_contig00002-0130 [Edwardsiella piscicida]GBK57111.1 hypothetical protein JFPO14_contig00003-0309 [Edwardsiella piscicida]
MRANASVNWDTINTFPSREAPAFLPDTLVARSHGQETLSAQERTLRHQGSEFKNTRAGGVLPQAIAGCC